MRDGLDICLQKVLAYVFSFLVVWCKIHLMAIGGTLH